MKRILLLSTIYPLPEGNMGTHVCHYFAREWVKMGYDVRVIHYQAVYPAPFYWAARIARKKIIAKTSAIVYTNRDKGGYYEMDGVSICRIPLFKPIPHGKYSKRAINKSMCQIVEWLTKDCFAPDIIVGHFPNPQIEVVSRLKKIWPQAISAIVLHLASENITIKKLYEKTFPLMSQMIDVWGFRNEPLCRLFEREVMTINNSFICYSGIPETYIAVNNSHDFTKPFKRFIYVGEMIERKYPLQILEALKIVYPNGDFEMTYVGQGGLFKDLVNYVETENLQSQVRLLGKIPRDRIKEEYDNADCMIMISKDEAYGLVYLEAMARGCITIASRNEGFDGVIKDGENGFLCEAGDENELSDVLKRIKCLTVQEKCEISKRAIETAKRLTDENAARMYIDDLILNSKDENR